MFLFQPFTTPIYHNIIEDQELVQQEIAGVVDEIKSKNGFKRNLASKCHSLSDPTFNSNIFTEYNIPGFKKQVEMNIMAYIGLLDRDYTDKFFIENSWIALNEPGDYTHNHHHDSADISGVYYFKTNGNDGELTFENPNRISSVSLLYKSWQERFHFKPAVGNLLLFPGWLVHNVLTNESDEERISVSFNVVIKRG